MTLCNDECLSGRPAGVTFA